MAAAAPVLLCILLILPHWPVGLFFDDGIYLILGRSLAAGEGLRYLNLPGEFSATRYPPVYPALLALLWRATDSVDAVAAMARMLNGVLLATLAGSLAIIIHRITPIAGYRASALAALAVLAAPLLNIALLPMSEPAFLVLAILGLCAAERARLTPDQLGMVAAAGVLGGLAYLTRSAALPLIVATLLLLAHRRAWRALGVYAVATLALLLPWHWWVAAHETALPAPLQASYGSYGTWYAAGLDGSVFHLAAATALRNLIQIPASLGVLVTPPPLASAHLGRWNRTAAAPCRGFLPAGPHLANFGLGAGWATLGLRPDLAVRSGPICPHHLAAAPAGPSTGRFS
jgi:4-amino-4-deoxy-L-arabinose transferase-like glycosyltransferase